MSNDANVSFSSDGEYTCSAISGVGSMAIGWSTGTIGGRTTDDNDLLVLRLELFPLWIVIKWSFSISLSVFNEFIVLVNGSLDPVSSMNVWSELSDGNDCFRYHTSLLLFVNDIFVCLDCPLTCKGSFFVDAGSASSKPVHILDTVSPMCVALLHLLFAITFGKVTCAFG